MSIRGELEPLAGMRVALAALCSIRSSPVTEMPSVLCDAWRWDLLRNGAQANLPEFSHAPL